MSDKLTETEVKKALYKEKPIAKFWIMNEPTGGCLYKCECSLGEITFSIPEEECKFDSGIMIWEQKEIPAQLLIRYLKL